MKKIFLLMALILACIVQSCSEAQVPTESIKMNQTRSQENVKVTITNPNLISDWENTEYIVLNSSSKRNPQKVTVPWKDGTSSSLPEDYYRTVQVHPTHYTITHTPNDRVEVYGTLEAPSFWHNANEFQIEINPDIRKYVKKVDKYITYAICSRADGKDRNQNDVYAAYQPSTLYRDNNTQTYSLPQNWEGWSCRTPFTSEQINERVNLMYYDLGEILEGNLIAYVTVEMDIDYNGHVFNVNETRAYPVDYGYTSECKPEEFHYPPYSFVINFGYPLRDDLWRLYNGDYTKVP